jgi:hypothetical protein
MGLRTALKSFFKAWKNPKEAEKFLSSSKKNVKQIGRDSGDHSHLRLLALLQEEARLIDFFQEDIQNYNDAQIGAAVRKIHSDCRTKLEDIVTIRPIFEEDEGQAIEIPAGYDGSTIKVVGNVKGAPPYQGVLRHKGWKAHKRSLPKQVGEQNQEVICPAEIEVQ